MADGNNSIKSAVATPAGVAVQAVAAIVAAAATRQPRYPRPRTMAADRAIRAIDIWIRRHERALAAVLIAVAVVLRALLIFASPMPFGYVWDFYHEGIVVIHTQGRLPVASDCWVCAHPPLFFLAGVPFHAFGLFVTGGSTTEALRWLGALSMIAAGVTIYYSYRLLRLYRCRGIRLIGGLAILLVLPCLFISSFGPEADILLAAFLSAFAYYLARAAARPALVSTIDAIRLGAMAGLAAATKASGLVGILALAMVAFAAVLLRRDRAKIVRLATVAILIAATLGGWPYLSSWQKYGTPFHAQGTAKQGFSLDDRREMGRPYEFMTFRLDALRRAIGPNIQTGTTLTELDVYNSVPTTLHALAWSDMSMFSVPSRHGSTALPYPWKFIPPSLTLTVILLGAVPTALAVLGIAVSLRRRRLLPLVAFGMLSLGAYVWWFLPQPSWALKTKYVLFLVTPYVLYVAIGLGWLGRRAPWLALAAGAALATLILLAHVYDYAFAMGGF